MRISLYQLVKHNTQHCSSCFRATEHRFMISDEFWPIFKYSLKSKKYRSWALLNLSKVNFFFLVHSDYAFTDFAVYCVKNYCYLTDLSDNLKFKCYKLTLYRPILRSRYVYYFKLHFCKFCLQCKFFSLKIPFINMENSSFPWYFYIFALSSYFVSLKFSAGVFTLTHGSSIWSFKHSWSFIESWYK